MKHYKDTDVLTEARKRISYIFDNFEKIYVSFSGGKDSGVMTHLVMDEAIKRHRKVGLFFVDFEAQYDHTIKYVLEIYEMYKDYIIPLWVSLPIALTNNVSSYEPKWITWADNKKDVWVRHPTYLSITDQKYFPFYHYAMEFEEFIHHFGKWYSEDGKYSVACFIGIRASESLNRHLKVRVKQNREFFNNKMWAIKQKSTGLNIYSVHPIYDWETRDIWIYNGKFNKAYNKIYDLMQQAGLPLSQQRLCQPYGHDQRKGLWLFHILEPKTWSKIVARVNGANSGSNFVQYSGNISGQIKITKPPGHTWESFAKLLLKTLPKKTADHYDDKIFQFLEWWKRKGGYWDFNMVFHEFENGNIPDEVSRKLEVARKAPSWRRICKVLLRGDYWCKDLSFCQNKSKSYQQYKTYMAARKKNGGYIPLWI